MVAQTNHQLKLNAAKNKFDRSDLFTNGKNHRGKTPLVLPINHKRLQVKGIPVPNTNLQLKPYPNTQLALYCNDNLSVQCTNPNT